MSFIRTTAFSLKNDFDQNKLSSTEVIRQVYKRINSLNTKINAYISLFEAEALSYAAKADSIWNDPKQAGKLQGIPLAISGNLLEEDYESNPLKNNLLKILKEEGAIIIGTTSKPANNPWNTSKSAGYTSGGAAAAVAAGMASLALSLDCSSNIIEAAAFCGVLGLKTSANTSLNHSIMLDKETKYSVGLFAKNVRDCALLLNSLSAGMNIPYDCIYDSSYSSHRIAILENLINECQDQEIKNSVELSIAVLNNLGFTVDKVSLDDYKNTKSFTKRLFGNYEIILSPSMPVLPYTSESTHFREDCKVNIFDEYPLLSLPCGFSSSDLPIGLQLVSDNGNELILLQVAAALEKSLSLSII